MTEIRGIARLSLAALIVTVLAAGCGGNGGAGTGGTSALPDDTTPTNRSSGPLPSPDSVPAGGAGGAGAGDDIGSGGGQ